MAQRPRLRGVDGTTAQAERVGQDRGRTDSPGVGHRDDNSTHPGRVMIARAVVAAAALCLAGCGTSGPPTSAGSGSELQPRPKQGDGLALRISGLVDGEVLCPGGRRPCLPFDGSIEPATDGTVWVSGRLADGAFVVDDQQPLLSVGRRDYANRCPGQEFAGSPSTAVLETMHEDLSQRPAGYADLWDSDDGVLHLGVAGDPGPARAFLNELGISDQVCLVTGFPYPDEVLERAQQAVVEAGRNYGIDGFGVSRDSWEGTVSIDLPRFDLGFREQLEEISAANDGVPITAVAGVEVINGSLEDYEVAVASLAVTPDPAQQLTARCGSVVFSSVPPDLDEFSSLDDDAQAALDELVNGPTGVEADGLDRGYRWTIASRTADQLVLFGQGSVGDEPAWADVRFERRAGFWSPTGWGGCRVEMESPGLGPATVAANSEQPLDPSSTELSLLINEQACANGGPPVDREIVPLVTETDESVTIIVLVAPVEGPATCPGNPWHPITVTLESPLGARLMLDGHHYPPRPVAAANPAPDPGNPGPPGVDGP